MKKILISALLAALGIYLSHSRLNEVGKLSTKMLVDIENKGTEAAKKIKKETPPAKYAQKENLPPLKKTLRECTKTPNVIDDKVFECMKGN